MADTVPGAASSTAILNINSSVTSAIDSLGDTDWFAVNLTAGVQYQFDLTGSSGDGAAAGLTLVDPYLVLRDGAGTLVVSDDSDGLLKNARIIFTPTTSGKYFLDAQEAGNNASGSYRLMANSTPTSGVLALGTSKTGTIDFVGDVDRYSVSLTAGVAYAFSVDGAALSNPFLEVLNSDGTTVGSNDDHDPGLNAYLTYAPTTSGTYYLAARASGNNATGAYIAKVESLPTFAIAGGKVTEGDSGTSYLRFTVTLSSASPSGSTVTYATSDSSAKAGRDYMATTGSLTIAAGSTSASIDVPIYGNTIFQPNRAFFVTLSSPQTAALGSLSRATGYIHDNDAPSGITLPSDSYSGYEWYLWDVNVFKVWNNYSGLGVRVAVFDQGIDSSNADLSPNTQTQLGRKASDLSAGGMPVLTSDNHGTAVAGVIAAARNNYECVGVAYGAQLVSIYSPLSGKTLPGDIANAYAYAGNFDIINDSWGFGNAAFSSSSNWAFYDNFAGSTFSAAGAALKTLADTGRNGLGTVVVQSAGNAYGYGDDTNLHNFQNSRYIITVASTTYDQTISSFSSPGASILVSAPGGDGTKSFTDILTTDRVGSAGFNSTADYGWEAGTSFAAPIVSGIVALMLEANPSLGYRDVQEILAYSARTITANTSSWKYNGATNWNGGGLHFDSADGSGNHNFGFGMVDALAAVRLAETWGKSPNISGNVREVSAASIPHLMIPDNAPGIADVIQVTQAIKVERAEVALNVTHPWIGDLSVKLTSPSGTVSALVHRPGSGALSAYGSSQDNIHFTFDSVLDWGESSAGTWKLTVWDAVAGAVGSLDSWTLTLIGAPVSSDDVYIYTDEFAETVGDQATRSTLSDTGGTDTLNAAACSSNLVLNLAPESVSTIDGRNLTIAPGTVIENAIGGDGNDTLAGNSGRNELRGMRGNDTIDGSAGIDTAVYLAPRSSYSITKTATGFTISGSIDGADTLANIERLRFADTKLAVDFDGNAAATAKILGAVFGAGSLSNKPYAGIGLSLLDDGLSHTDLMTLALSAAGASTHAAVVDLLWTNLFHSAPTATQAAPYVAWLDNGTYTPEALALMAADLEVNKANINLVGLTQTGIEFS